MGEFWWLLCLLGCFWCLNTPFVSDQRLFFVYFLGFVLVIHLSIFCFEISALGLFYLGALLGCYLWVVAGYGGCRFISLLTYLIYCKKYKNIFLLHTYASLAFCIGTVLALGFLTIIIVIFSYRNDCTYIWRKNIASHLVAYPIFHSTELHLALLDRCTYLLHWWVIASLVAWPFVFTAN